MKGPRRSRSTGGGGKPRSGAKARGNGSTRSGNGATAAHSAERYIALAREAEAAGDIVQSQYWYQHAEHYLRKAADNAAAD